MSFFKNFKDDFSQAVNELIPTETSDKNEKVNKLEKEAEVTEANQGKTKEYDNKKHSLDSDLTQEPKDTDNTTETFEKNEKLQDDNIDLDTEPNLMGPSGMNEVTIIAKGTLVNGSITSEGSLEVMGVINGDVECQGKLSIIGKMTGNCSASEVYVTSERLLGCIISENNVRIGQGAVIIGDITATSGFFAGAIKGDIDINGSIIIESTAVIQGNIKAKSIQVNKGAIIEGFCSLCYASVDIDNIFA